MITKRKVALIGLGAAVFQLIIFLATLVFFQWCYAHLKSSDFLILVGACFYFKLSDIQQNLKGIKNRMREEEFKSAMDKILNQK